MSVRGAKDLILDYCTRQGRPVRVEELANYLGSDWDLSRTAELVRVMLRKRELRESSKKEEKLYQVSGVRVAVDSSRRSKGRLQASGKARERSDPLSQPEQSPEESGRTP